ncbi:MAG: suppressor of fused domain protein [Enhygromyxa sp.]
MSDVSDEEEHEPIEAPGWDAIDRWVGAHFGAQVPHQFTSQTAFELDSPSPLPAITVWSTKAPEGWLYVTYGLSELFDKSSEDPSLSGFGFELTFRIPRPPGQNGDSKPPLWPLRLLQGLGRHVLTTRAGFDSGHTLDLGAPIVPPNSDGPEHCELSGMVCLPDPLLGKIETVHGSLLFLRLFGITPDELTILSELSLGSLVACIAELSPMAVTDPTRASFSEDPERSKVLTRYKLGIEL